MLKEAGAEGLLIREVEEAIEKSKHVKDEEGWRDFFRRDVSLIQDNRGAGTIYAVDVDNAPEMNLVEKVFRSRDMLLEKGQLSIILPEEELKKHQKDPKMNPTEMSGLMYGGSRKDGGHLPSGYGNVDVMKGGFTDVNMHRDGGKMSPSTMARVRLIPSGSLVDDVGSSYPLPKHPEPRIVVPHDSLNQERYCICAKKNDNQQYVQCEDECEWYHPECVGFKQDLFDIKQVKFLCPFCKPDTRKKIQQLEQRGHYKKIKSETKNEYFAYLPEGFF